MFKADLHIHTHYSRDSIINLEELIKKAREIGLNAIAITDHDTIKGALKIFREYDGKDIIIIPGIEITTKYGHLLALNITTLPKMRGSLNEIIDSIHKKGGIAVPAHPFDYFRRFKHLEKNIGYMDAIEAANASSLRLYRDIGKAMEFSEKYDIGYTAGSDAHIIDAVGNVYLYSENPIQSIDDIIQYIIKRRFKIFARRTSLKIRMKKILKTL